MKKINLCLFLLMASCACMWGQVNVDANKKGWTLKTRSAMYRIAVSDEGNVNMFHFGSDHKVVSKLSGPLGEEVTVRGGFNTTTPVVEAIFDDQVRDIELVYDGYELTEQDGYQVLTIRQKDRVYPLTVTEHIRVLPEYDLIEKWLEIGNTSKKKAITIENLQSGTFFLPKSMYELTHFSGVWGGEFRPQTTLLTQGLKTIQTKRLRSYGFPTFILRPQGEQMQSVGEAWFGSLQYSGNWRLDFEKNQDGQVQVAGGINFWDQSLELSPKEKFVTPKLILGYTTKGMDGVSKSLVNYSKEKVIYPSHRTETRPVIYNSWYATEFSVNEEQQLALANIAKDLGVEMFVIDDGWFKNRVNDRGGLGDWVVDKKRFPNGLKSMIEKINAMGMDFGLWMEPEMVNPNSDLFRAHPDWAFHYPNRERHQMRNQYMLNLGREDVYQYLYGCLSKLLKENNIKYIKWDMNRSLTDAGFPGATLKEQRAVRIKYVENLYRLYDNLRKDFPHVWFENCAGGGGRVDLGMMARTDFCWASDNTDPIERIFIQDAFLNIMPSNYMISWVTREDHHRLNYPLDFKFDVAMCGVLGVGYDITKWSDEQKKTATEKIKRYKEIRETVHFGDLYKILSPYNTNRSILQFMNKNQKEGVIFVFNLAEYPNNAMPDTKVSSRVKLRGLDPNANYKLEGNDEVFTGDYLMNVGIYFPVYGAYKSGNFKLIKQ